MYYHYPYTGGSAYVLWRRFTSKRKTGISRIRLYMSTVVRGAPKYHTFLSVCRIGDLSIMLSLIRQGIDPMLWLIKYRNNTSIQMASQYGHFHIVRWLYSMGCDPNIGENWTFAYACKNGHLKIAKWVNKMGYNPSDDVNRAGLIYLASEKGQLRIIKWLINIGFGIDTHILIQLALDNGHLHVVEWLKKHGVGK